MNGSNRGRTSINKERKNFKTAKNRTCIGMVMMLESEATFEIVSRDFIAAQIAPSKPEKFNHKMRNRCTGGYYCACLKPNGGFNRQALGRNYIQPQNGKVLTFASS
jgi:hypothetical protein